jgi:hypothetical protein
MALEFPGMHLGGNLVNGGSIRGPIGQMRCAPEHSTLVLYAASTRTGTKALPALPGSDSPTRNSFPVTRHICGNRNSFYPAKRARRSHLTSTQAEPHEFPRTLLVGNSVNRGTQLKLMDLVPIVL